MKLLFDQNLSPKLTARLSSTYPDAKHVQDIGLDAADDSAVWDFALENDFLIVSKDSDFSDRGSMFGHPPKVIWIRLGNCSTKAIERILKRYASEIKLFSESAETGTLTLF